MNEKSPKVIIERLAKAHLKACRKFHREAASRLLRYDAPTRRAVLRAARQKARELERAIEQGSSFLVELDADYLLRKLRVERDECFQGGAEGYSELCKRLLQVEAQALEGYQHLRRV